MKLAIPTYNRADIITTPYLNTFSGYDIYLIFHSEEDKRSYELKNDISKFTSVVTDIPASSDGTAKAKNIEYFIDKYIDDGEWFIFADDNVVSVEGIVDEVVWQQPSLENITRDWFGLYDFETFDKRINEVIEKADSINAHLIGFQVSKNYFYAHTKYRTRGYVLGKLYLWKKDENFEYDKPFVAMEDFHFSAMHLLNYGCLLLCDYLWANAKHFQGGGLGTRDERRSNHAYGTEFMSKKYPGLLKPKTRKDNYPDLRFVTMSDYNFHVWLATYKKFREEYAFNNKLMKWLRRASIW